jgi:tight adherence protein C
MHIGIAALLFVTVAVGVFALAAGFLAPRSVLAARVRSLLMRDDEAQENPGLKERIEDVVKPLGRVVPKSPSEVSRTRAWLMQAGYRDPKHLSIYYGIRGFMTLCAVALAVTVNLATRSPMLTVGLAMFGFMLPRFVLKRTIKKRQIDIKLSLPDALDLAVICVEAGVGLDQAIQRVSDDLKHVHAALAEELQLVVLEVRAGRSRADALRNLVLRTGVDDVRALVTVLVQTDRFGTSVAQALRVHADALRTERRQRAEERAAKTTIKMVPALIFFVLPSMFFVTLGPAFIQLVRNLLPVIDNAK